MSRSLVTVGVPVFNGADYLEDALRSIRSQTHAELQILVADNASTDASLDIAMAAADDDDRITVLTAPENLGAAWNYNRLLDDARGTYFRWAAHDDLLAPDNIGSCVEVLDARPEVVLAYPQTMIIDADGEPVRTYDERMDVDLGGDIRRAATLLWQLRLCNSVFGVIRTDALRATPLIQSFDSSDVALLAELALRGRFVQVDGRSFLRRRHDSASRAANPDATAVATWFAPDAKSGRSRPLMMSYQRSARSWAPDIGRAAAASAMFAVVGAVTELRWHRRRRRRERR